MSIVTQVLALVVALVHGLAFVWEVVLFNRPSVHRDLFKTRTEDIPANRLWSFNVGWYNLFLAAGPVAGVIVYHVGEAAAGRALVLYACAFAFLAGLALFASDRMALSRPKGAGVTGSLAQSLPAAATIVALLV